MMIVNSTAPQSRPKTQFGALYHLTGNNTFTPRPLAIEVAHLNDLLKSHLLLTSHTHNSATFQIGDQTAFMQNPSGDIFEVACNTLELTPEDTLIYESLEGDSFQTQLLTSEDAPPEYHILLKALKEAISTTRRLFGDMTPTTRDATINRPSKKPFPDTTGAIWINKTRDEPPQTKALDEALEEAPDEKGEETILFQGLVPTTSSTSINPRSKETFPRIINDDSED